MSMIKFCEHCGMYVPGEEFVAEFGESSLEIEKTALGLMMGLLTCNGAAVKERGPELAPHGITFLFNDEEMRDVLFAMAIDCIEKAKRAQAHKSLGGKIPSEIIDKVFDIGTTMMSSLHRSRGECDCEKCKARRKRESKASEN